MIYKIKLAKLERKQKQEVKQKEEVIAKIPQQVYPSLRVDSLNQSPPIIQPPAINSQPSSLKTYSVDLNTLNIFKKSNSNLQNVHSSNNLSKELEELRRKIEQRRVTVNK